MKPARRRPSRQGKRPKVTDETLAAIVSILHNQAEKAPPGFKSSKDWQLTWGLRRSSTQRYLDKGEKAGVLKKIMIRCDLGAYVRQVPHWGLAKKSRQPRKG